MANASTLENMSPQLVKVAERAQREPEGRFHSLAHLIDVPALERTYRRIRKDAAAGVDGVTKESYGEELEQNLRDLHVRLKEARESEGCIGALTSGNLLANRTRPSKGGPC